MQTANSSQPPGNKKKNNNCNKKKNTSTEHTEQTNSESNARGNKGRCKFKYPCMVCQEDPKTQDCPRLTNIQNYVKQGQPSSQPAVLTNPFPTPQQIVAQALALAFGGASSSSATILMTGTVIGLSTRAKNYDPSEGCSTPDDIPSTSQPNLPLRIKKPTFELPSCPSKAIVRRTTHNFNARTAQHYSIIEDLAQAPCAMSALEVLQSFPTQQKALLTVIGGVDPYDTSLISFDSDNCEPRLPPSVTFMLTIRYLDKNIC